MVAAALIALLLQPVGLEPQASPAEAEVRQADAAFWAAYAACDRAAMADAFTADAEFYHDITGLTRTREAIVQSLMEGPCGVSGQRLRREAVAGAVRADPLAGPYMVLTGEHLFYVQRSGQADRMSARARFADIWRHEDGRWRMLRVISYDHRPPPYAPPPVDESADPALWTAYAGRYRSADFGDIWISVEGIRLQMRSGDLTLFLIPVGPHRFAAEARDLQVDFDDEGLTVFEAGTPVAAASRVR